MASRMKRRSSAGCNQQFPATGMDIFAGRYSKQVPCDTSHKECGRRVITNRNRSTTTTQGTRSIYIDTEAARGTRSDTRAGAIRTVDTNPLPHSDQYFDISDRYVQFVRPIQPKIQQYGDTYIPYSRTDSCYSLLSILTAIEPIEILIGEPYLL